jgi:transmembrane sensor
MAMNDITARQEAALGWLVRTTDPDFDAWDEFTLWLEADEANAEAYHQVSLSQSEMLPVADAALRAPAAAARRLGSFRLASGIAAAAAAVLAIVMAPRLAPVEYQTRPGEMRTVPLGGKDRLVMNGGTKLAVGGWFSHDVRLDEGQVLLSLPGEGPSKVAVLSGDLKLVDVGTVFEVTRDGAGTRVLVSEGAVVADPRGAALRINAGQRLDTSDGANVLRAAAGDTDSVGAFERGQLTYVNEALPDVLADVRRSTGLDISAPEAMKARRFTGTLSLAQVRHDPRSLARLLGVSIERSNHGWELQEGA